MFKQLLAVLTILITILVTLLLFSCDEIGTNPTETLETPVITVTSDTSKLIVSWAAISGASSYTVYWSETAGVTTSSNIIPNITATQCNDQGIANGITRYYKVAAIGENGASSELSEEASGTPISAILTIPEKFTATPGNKEVSFTWDKSDGANTYSIYWATTAGVDAQSTSIDSITARAYTHTGLTNGKTYYYKIAAKDGIGNSSDLSTEKSATPVSGVATPENLTAIPGNAFVTLNIDPYSGGKETSFRIYWDDEAGVNSSSDTIAASDKKISFPYTISGLTNGTTYYYRVSAIDGGVESDLSNEASATPSDTISIGIPQKVKATKGDAQVGLSWGAVVGAVKYNIHWATTAGVTDGSPSIPVTGKPNYIHTGLTNGTTYYYRVNAEDADGDKSELSLEVSATPDTSSSDQTPKNVVATPGAGSIAITWDAVNEGEVYSIFGNTSPGITSKSPTIASKLPKETTSYTHTPVTAGTTYYYKVGVYIESSSGKWELFLSKEVSATPTK